ncbi:hypothetical protein IMZ48_23295, partial [Candidatus Bathyarchaeota archaeon]|nr:hypothetical protein [Candidatus Bathyarchaeota archaeon]
MHFHYSFLLLVGCLFSFSGHALAAPSSDSSGVARDNPYDSDPYDSAYNDEKQPPGDHASISRNTPRGDTPPSGTCECNKKRDHIECMVSGNGGWGEDFGRKVRDHVKRCDQWGNTPYRFQKLGNPDPDATGYDWEAMLE